MSITLTSPADAAELFQGWVHETSPNQGLWVNGFQIIAGGQRGDSWCMEAAWCCECMFMRGAPRFPREQSVNEFLELARSNGWVVEAPQRGDYVVSVNAAGVGHHIGICTTPSPLTTSAGNTSRDGTSSNGDGWWEHPVSPDGKVYIRPQP